MGGVAERARLGADPTNPPDQSDHELDPRRRLEVHACLLYIIVGSLLRACPHHLTSLRLGVRKLKRHLDARNRG